MNYFKFLARALDWFWNRSPPCLLIPVVVSLAWLLLPAAAVLVVKGVLLVAAWAAAPTVVVTAATVEAAVQVTLYLSWIGLAIATMGTLISLLYRL